MLTKGFRMFFLLFYSCYSYSYPQCLRCLPGHPASHLRAFCHKIWVAVIFFTIKKKRTKQIFTLLKQGWKSSGALTQPVLHLPGTCGTTVPQSHSEVAQGSKPQLCFLAAKVHFRTPSPAGFQSSCFSPNSHPSTAWGPGRPPLFAIKGFLGFFPPRPAISFQEGDLLWP